MRDIENTCHICHYFCRSEMPLAHCPRCDADWTDITQEILLRETSCHYRDGTFDGADGFLFITTQRIFWYTQGRPTMIYVANSVISALGAMIMAAFNHAAWNKKEHAPKRLFSIQHSDLQTATIEKRGMFNKALVIITYAGFEYIREHVKISDRMIR